MPLHRSIGQSPIEDVIRYGGAGAGVIILDACRSNGLEHDVRAGRGVKGLASTPIDTGMLVVCAASSGKCSYNAPGQPGVFNRGARQGTGSTRTA